MIEYLDTPLSVEHLREFSLFESEKREKIYLLITFNPFCIALCNGEFFSNCIGEKSNWIADERFMMDERCSLVSS